MIWRSGAGAKSEGPRRAQEERKSDTPTNPGPVLSLFRSALVQNVCTMNAAALRWFLVFNVTQNTKRTDPPLARTDYRST